LIQRGHPALRELELRPSSHHSNPLRGRCPRNLLLQHAQRVSERWHTIPTQLHVVVKPAADRMHVRVIQAGDDRPATAVDHIRRRPTLPQNLVTATDRTDLSVLDSN